MKKINIVFIVLFLPILLFAENNCAELFMNLVNSFANAEKKLNEITLYKKILQENQTDELNMYNFYLHEDIVSRIEEFEKNRKNYLSECFNYIKEFNEQKCNDSVSLDDAATFKTIVDRMSQN